MTSQDETSTSGRISAGGLPAGAEIQWIRFASAQEADQEVLVELPDTPDLRAVIAARNPDPRQAIGPRDILALLVPTERDAGVDPEDEDTLARARAWVDEPFDRPTAMMTTLQGVRVYWTHGRIAVLATRERLQPVCAALVEAMYYEAELHEIEMELAKEWPQMESDIPTAFDVKAMPESRLNELRRRFQHTVLLSSRLARIGPRVHCPHLHPPTLASQINERFRERTQMAHRHELVGEQIEVFEEVYARCGERASEFKLETRGHTLEIVIIVLLLAQLVFGVFEALTGLVP
jgi:hypothetical protein